MDTIRSVLEKLQSCDCEKSFTVRISNVYDFDECVDMWQGLAKNIPEKLLDAVVCMMSVDMKYPEDEVEKITFEVPEEDLHAALKELDEGCVLAEKIIDEVLVFQTEDKEKFYEYTTVYYDRDSKNLLVVPDGFYMDFESELDDNIIQLTKIGGKKLHVLVPEELPFSEEVTE